MAKLIPSPTRVKSAGNKPKVIDEFAGRVNNHEERVSVAKMQSPKGWEEPGQTPEFDEYTLVLKGKLHVKTEDDEFDVEAGQAVLAPKNEWVQYSTPEAVTEYVAVCLPAFSPKTVHRDE